MKASTKNGLLILRRLIAEELSSFNKGAEGKKYFIKAVLVVTQLDLIDS